MNKTRIWTVTGILSGLAAVLYRLGGIGLPFNTKFRDLGVPFCMLAFFLFSGIWNWWLLLCWGLMFAAQTTYFKKKGTDAQWYHWLFCGLAFSFCMLPYSWAAGHWLGFTYRFFAVTTLTTIWSQAISIDWLEEGGRGFIQIITLPLLLL
jgi:hypothetical protein